MRDPDFEDLLREHFELEALGREFVDASGYTDRCLTVPRLVEVGRRGLAKEEREHVSSCPYCLKGVQASYRVEHPSLGMLSGFLLRQTGIERAIEAHLTLDACSQCQGKLDAGALGLVNKLIEAGKLARGALALSFAPGFGFVLQGTAKAPAEPFQHSAEGKEGLRAWLRQESAELKLRIRSENPGDVGRTVFAMIVLEEGEPLTAELKLEQYTIRKDGQPVQIAMAEHGFGPFGSLAEALAKGFNLIFGFTRSAESSI